MSLPHLLEKVIVNGQDCLQCSLTFPSRFLHFSISFIMDLIDFNALFCKALEVELCWNLIVPATLVGKFIFRISFHSFFIKVSFEVVSNFLFGIRSLLLSLCLCSATVHVDITVITITFIHLFQENVILRISLAFRTTVIFKWTLWEIVKYILQDKDEVYFPDYSRIWEIWG